jgi:hypothetical protein
VTQAMSEMIMDNNLKFVCSTPRSTMPWWRSTETSKKLGEDRRVH